MVPIDRVLELVWGNTWGDHKVVLVTGSHHSLIILLSMRHAPVNFPVVMVDLKLASVHELVFSRDS